MFSVEGRRFIRGVGVVSFFVLLSRITGLFRDISLAFFLGASYITDALFVSWAIPNTLRRFFAEGLLAPAFVPSFSSAIRKGEVQKAFSSVLGSVIIITGGLSLTLLILSPVLPHVLSPGFPDDIKKQASEFLAMLSPYLLLISIATLLSALLNSFRIFGLPASTMSVFNISTVLGILLLSHSAPHLGFILGVFLGVGAQIIIQLFVIRKKGVKIQPRFERTEYSKMVISAIPPVLAGGAIYQINFLVSRAIASFGGENVISYLTYAMRFFELPLGVFVYSISFVALPSFAGEKKEREESLSQSVFLTSCISIPASFALFFLSEPIIHLVFGYGKFSPSDVRETAKALSMYSLGLLPVALSRTLITDFQARRKLSIPVVAGVVNFFVNVILCLLLVHKYKHIGIALASSISSLAGFLVLFLFSDRKGDVAKHLGIAFFVSVVPSFSIFMFSVWYAEAQLSRIFGFLAILTMALCTFGLIMLFSYLAVKKLRVIR